MADVALLWADAATRTVQGELLADSITWTEALNSPGSLTASVPLRQERPGATRVVTDQQVDPGRTLLAVERDGVVLWAGWLWDVSADVRASQLRLTASGPMSVLRRRHVLVDKTFTQVDQITIARTLIDDAQAVYSNSQVGISIGSDIGIDTTTDTTTSGVLRDRTYYAAERHVVADVLENLAAVDGGFDFRFEPTRNTSLGWIFRPSYPAEGRKTAHVFELGVNVDLLDVRRDGSALANTVFGVGAGERDEQLSVVGVDTSALETYPHLEAVVAHPDVRTTDTLVDHVNRRLSRGRQPVTTVRMAVRPDAVPALGSYLVGDQVRVRGSFGWLDLDATFRLTAISVTVSGGGELVTLDAAGLEAWT